VNKFTSHVTHSKDDHDIIYIIYVTRNQKSKTEKLFSNTYLYETVPQSSKTFANFIRYILDTILFHKNSKNSTKTLSVAWRWTKLFSPFDVMYELMLMRRNKFLSHHCPFRIKRNKAKKEGTREKHRRNRYLYNLGTVSKKNIEQIWELRGIRFGEDEEKNFF
jgi:hypothetical protein